MSIFGNNHNAASATSIPIGCTETLENAERISAIDYKWWLRNQIDWYQNELRDVEAFLRGENDCACETDPLDEQEA